MPDGFFSYPNLFSWLAMTDLVWCALTIGSSDGNCKAVLCFSSIRATAFLYLAPQKRDSSDSSCCAQAAVLIAVL